MEDCPSTTGQPPSTPNRRTRHFKSWALTLLVGVIVLGSGVAGILWLARIVRERQNLKERVVGAGKAILDEPSNSAVPKENHMAIRSAIEQFWNWFSENSHRFSSLAKNPSKGKLLDEILSRLHSVNAGLYLEVSVPVNGVNEFVITAEGKKSLFPVIDEMISVAPKLDGWKFTALRPPMGFGVGIKYAGVSLKPDEMWFLPLTAGPNAEQFGLRLGIPNLAHTDKPAALNAGRILLDTCLGERQCAESIEHVEVVALPKNPKGEGFFALTELVDYLNWRESRRRPDK